MHEPAAIEQNVMFTNPVYLAFDPTKLPAGDTLREIFADDLARTLWLSWRARHIVNQHFADEVLVLAALIRARRLASAQELANLVRVRAWYPGGNFHRASVVAWAEQVFPYLYDGESLAWAIYRPEAA